MAYKCYQINSFNRTTNRQGTDIQFKFFILWKYKIILTYPWLYLTKNISFANVYLRWECKIWFQLTLRVIGKCNDAKIYQRFFVLFNVLGYLHFLNVIHSEVLSRTTYCSKEHFLRLKKCSSIMGELFKFSSFVFHSF